MAVTAASSAAGFFAGFALLIGPQAVAFACGLLLGWRERTHRVACSLWFTAFAAFTAA